MLLQSNFAELIACFYMPPAAENFIKGLFLNQQLQIADRKSKTTFQITVGRKPVFYSHFKSSESFSAYFTPGSW
jgi:hypothetical protein